MPTLNIRLTDSQAERLAAEAEAFGITKGGLLKSRYFEDARPRKVPRPDQKELAKITAQLGKLGGNVNQIAKKLNQHGAGPEDRRSLGRIQHDLAQIRQATFEALGLSE
ncbi:MAG: MobC family plasmid mobilization relaxosome protein [Candidatus Thiodiazotropha taylori]|nr:MobC family plasmid mobilization relaxosome protein [Candidatus Thiodiazotropha taylori]MCW4305962.1 MobC family plasmid mobilization relaxosome protein [Candidatus Thiodiazotropha taylori]